MVGLPHSVPLVCRKSHELSLQVSIHCVDITVCSAVTKQTCSAHETAHISIDSLKYSLLRSYGSQQVIH
jgi:hypothetical protein